jgi:outer membrane protein insertion porin family
MLKKLLLNIVILFIFFFNSQAFSITIQKIIIDGNDRITDETIRLFADVIVGDDIVDSNLNKILKNLYDTNFFKDVSVEIIKNNLKIKVIESPMVNKIEIKGIKAKKNLKLIQDSLILKPKSSFNEYLLLKEKKSLIFTLKEKGFFFAEVNTLIEKIKNNQINIIHEINLGQKAKIRKITFIGNKIFKDNKLRSLILSEEYKFWKFISGKKYLSQDLIKLDERLLKNYYLNKGFYNVNINTSFAKLINKDEFELIFNIDANEKIYFGKLDLLYPGDFDEEHFFDLKTFLQDLEGKTYSIYSVEKILDKIDYITLNEEYLSVSASIDENLVSDKLNINFIIEETEKYYVERINIYGNNITRENVIRNQLEVDEGDPYNEILKNKSINNIKSLNFFKNVKSEVLDGKDINSKIININVDEKPTGEITAGAGFGTSGGTLAAGIKENNFLGKGLTVQANTTITEQTFRGIFSVTNPNFNNSDKSLSASVQATEIDQMTDFGYKTNKTGFELGTGFEYLDDFRLGLSTSTYFEKIETNSTASASKKKLVGNYWDTFLSLQFDYDKRNQKYKTSDGFRSFYKIDVPVISDNNTLTNTYDYKYFSELYENNITSFNIFLKSANSITGDDVKLTERLTIPSNKLRGFESGKVGPKDGDDFIGGNFITSVNISSTIPQIFQNIQNLDATIFLDAANIWGVDYDSSINDSNKIRSSIGIGIDWFSVIGPMSFTFSETISKDSTDITESFRFNIGTTF